MIVPSRALTSQLQRSVQLTKKFKFSLRSPLSLNVAANLSVMDSTNVQHMVRLVFRKSIQAVNPPDLVQREILVLNNKLHIREQTYKLNNNCYVVGFGKCVPGMALKVEEILGSHLQKGVISIPCGFLKSNQLYENKLALSDVSQISVYEGAKNNLPDEKAEQASKEIKRLAESLKESDILIVLISGGGSSLLTLAKPPLKIQEKLDLIQQLTKAGANIVELNTVRKKLSLLKGGGLASLAYSCRVVSLILSDVIGDPLDIIASGPTVFNPDKDEAALKVIEKYKLTDKVSPSVLKMLSEKNFNSLNNFSHVQNILIGNNKIALEAAARECTSLGFSPIIVSDSVSGMVSDVAETYLSIVMLLYRFLEKEISNKDLINGIIPILEKINVNEYDKDIIYSHILSQGTDTDHFCLVFGGEPTVKVTGTGSGGRNQELALRMAVKLHELELNSDIGECNVVFLSGGTDGIDGPTDAAGAITYSGQVKQALQDNLDPNDFISRNDSYNFFQNCNKGKDLIVTGHTGVNVMDIHILIVHKKAIHKKLDNECFDKKP